MSTVQPTDKVLVNRAGTSYSAPADMSTVQDTDLILVNRGGTDYKCTFLDWKNSQSKAPDVGTVTLSDVAGGGRFTSTAFPVSATMVEDGVPKSDKKLKAYVEGQLKTAAKSSAITKVDIVSEPVYSATLTASNGFNTPAKNGFDGNVGTGASSNAAGTLTWNATSYGLSGTLRVHVYFQPVVNNTFISVNGGTRIDVHTQGTPGTLGWVDFGNVGAINEVKIEASGAEGANTQAIEVNGNILIDSASVTKLTFADNTDLAKFTGGDALTEVTNAGTAGDATGTVASVDGTAKTITLATTAGTWDVGSSVKGPLKSSGPNAKLYCKLNAAGAVSDLQSADPGFTAWTPAGTGPYTGTVTFPATLPTGNPVDTDLPAGTTLTVEVEASNTSGSDSAKSATITPA